MGKHPLDYHHEFICVEEMVTVMVLFLQRLRIGWTILQVSLNRCHRDATVTIVVESFSSVVTRLDVLPDIVSWGTFVYRVKSIYLLNCSYSVWPQGVSTKKGNFFFVASVQRFMPLSLTSKYYFLSTEVGVMFKFETIAVSIWLKHNK